MAVATPVTTNTVLSEAQIALLKSLITQEMVQSNPDIIQLLFQTPSLGFEEKKYWLELLPFMSEEHVERLRGILVTERAKMNSLEEKYQESIHVIENSSKLSREDIQKMHTARRKKEQQSQMQEEGLESSILNELGKL